MDRLDQYRIFVQVAEMGSFINAAHALQVPRASVSAAVQQLESTMGTRLLHRTTRHVRLTADGVQLLERVRLFLCDAEDIDQLFHASQRKISGRLNVDVPSRIARRLIAPALPGFCAAILASSWRWVRPIARLIWCRRVLTVPCGLERCTTAVWSRFPWVISH